MDNNITPEIVELLDLSLTDAKNRGSHFLYPEHILLTLLELDNKNIIRLLKRLELNESQIYFDLKEYAFQSEINNILSTENCHYSIELRVVLNTFNKFVIINDNEKIDYLFLSMLKSKNKVNSFFYTKYNITDQKIIKLLNQNDMAVNFNEPSLFDINKPKGKKDSILSMFCVNLNEFVVKNKINNVISRDTELDRLINILSKKNKNNAILIGEPGVGKTALIEGFAKLIVNSKVPKNLINKKVYSLDVSSVVAGTKYRGQFEERMKSIIDECKSDGDIILFIDEIHTIVGAGNTDGGLDISNILKPAMARDGVQIIGATTLDEYRERIEKDKALTRRFQEIILTEPSIEDSITILNNIKTSYENFHKVKYSDKIIEQCVLLTSRYITDKYLPDKAIDLIDELGSFVNADSKPPKEISEYEEKLNNLIKLKHEVIKTEKYDEASNLRIKQKEIEEKLNILKNDWLNNFDKVYKDITLNDVRLLLSKQTNIPLSNLDTNDLTNLKYLDKRLKDVVIGQDNAIEKITTSIKLNRLGLSDPNKPQASYLLVGNTGVGKTITAKLLTKELFGDTKKMFRFDMSEYMESHTVSKLIGSPPGYIGHEKGGKLTELVRKTPYSVILFDEIEKANPLIYNILLQILDDGHITDSLGRVINFKNTIILLTSNVGAREAKDAPTPVGFANSSKQTIDTVKLQIMDKEIKKRFSPEFINRLDDIIFFNDLNEKDVNKIIKLELTNFINRIDYNVKYSDGVISVLFEKGFDKKFGARPIKRAIKELIEKPMAELIINGDLTKQNQLVITKSKKENGLLLNVK